MWAASSSYRNIHKTAIQHKNVYFSAIIEGVLATKNRQNGNVVKFYGKARTFWLKNIQIQ